MIISNVQACRNADCSRRLVADGGGVAFDVQVATNTTAQAEALNAEVKGGSSAEEAAVLAEFKAEIGVVKADPGYEDVPPDFSIPAALVVELQQGEVALETVAPTPAPATSPAAGGGDTDAAGDGLGLVGPVAGAAAGVALLAGAALWRRSRARKAATTKDVRVDSLPELHEVYPGAATPGTAGKVGADEQQSSVL